MLVCRIFRIRVTWVWMFDNSDLVIVVIVDTYIKKFYFIIGLIGIVFRLFYRDEEMEFYGL